MRDYIKDTLQCERAPIRVDRNHDWDFPKSTDSRFRVVILRMRWRV